MPESNSKTRQVKKMIEFLKRRESYSHSPDSVQHIQTHISNVFMAPPYVYKIKKCVDFGFLDYSTLENRKHYCEQEVELNRRLCSEIYIGVECIVESENGFKIISRGSISDNESIVDYAVKMRMLDEKYFLHTFIEQNTLTNEHLDRVADKLADFYIDQSPEESVVSYGEIDKIRYNTDENFSQTEQFVGDTINSEAFDAINYFTDRYLDQNEELFQNRIEENRIVDGHGDLHLEHIHVNPEGVCIYDCIEFNERLRYGDQAVDLAFLGMDLDYNDRWTESRYFVDQMAQKLTDPDLTIIIDFYKCYRAYVKGKVKSLKTLDETVDEGDKKQAGDNAKVYFNLSLRYALIGSRPLILVSMGRIGTGKSTLASYLGDKLNIGLFSSDKIRKEIAGVPLYNRPSAEKREEIYSSGMSRKTYRALTQHAITSFKEGRSVILDATFSKRAGRRELIDNLEALGADYLFIEAQASDEIIKSRLKSRENDNETVSDARLEDFEMLTDRYEPPIEISTGNKIEIDTGSELEVTIKKLYRKLIDLQLNKVN